MNVKELERWLADRTAIKLSEIDHRNRYLREAGMLPLAGRGFYAAQLFADHVVRVLIALAAAESAPDSSRVAELFYSMLSVDGQGATFGEELAALLEEPTHASKVAFVRFRLTEPAAVIAWEASDGVVVEKQYLPADEAAKPIEQRALPGPVCREVTIRGVQFFHHLSVDLKHAGRSIVDKGE